MNKFYEKNKQKTKKDLNITLIRYKVYREMVVGVIMFLPLIYLTTLYIWYTYVPVEYFPVFTVVWSSWFVVAVGALALSYFSVKAREEILELIKEERVDSSEF